MFKKFAVSKMHEFIGSTSILNFNFNLKKIISKKKGTIR